MVHRKLFTHDVSAKLISLVAAVLVWSTIRFAVLTDDSRDVRPFATQSALPPATRSFDEMPITVMTTVDDLRGFKVEPSTVNVIVSGDPSVLGRITRADVHVFVNLRDVIELRDMRKGIQVYLPPGVKVVSMVPADVRVERYGPPLPPGLNK